MLQTIIALAGAVSLLLWGTHMVQTGVCRAFGPGLRRVLQSALRHRGYGFIAGVGATAVLQSSTATGLIVSGFAAEGMIDLVQGLAIMLGANVGTTLIVQLLAFDISTWAPLPIFIGVLLFRRYRNTYRQDIGRALIGLGLMLLALHGLLQAVTPFEDAPLLQDALLGLSALPFCAVILSAVVTWLAHSSVGVILIVISLATKNMVPMDTAFALVLGANLGTAINPVFEAVAGGDLAQKRLPLGNLLARASGVLVITFVLLPVSHLFAAYIPVPARALADFHLVFNLLLALAFLPFLDGYARILTRLFPARESAEGVSDVRYRVPAERAGASGVLSLAIADVAHLMSLFDVLLGASEGALMHAKRDDMTRNKALCRRLRTLSRTMQASLSAVDIDGFSENDHRRLEAITKFIGNIHGATSIVERGLRQLIKSSWEKGTSIPAADHAFLKDVFDRVRENAWAAVGLLTNGGSDDELKHMCTAQWLSAQRDGFVELERQAKEHDVECLRAGLFDNAFRLDIIREMQSIHACLIADFDSIVECLGGLAMPMSPPGLRHN